MKAENKSGNGAWETPVTALDREIMADFMFLGSKHETVAHLREEILRGDQDDMPITRAIAYTRARLAEIANASGKEAE